MTTHTPLQPTFNLAEGSPIELVWDTEMLSYAHSAYGSWSCKAEEITVPRDQGTLYRSHTHDEGGTAIIRHDAGVARVQLYTSNQTVHVTTIGSTPERADSLLAKYREVYPRAEAAADAIRARFWAYTPNGPQSYNRELAAPTWEEIEGNYSRRARDQLDWLMDDGFRPSASTGGGQLILWHGEPGTGKTTALRALFREWIEWAELHYITDPENFFGTHSDYMLKVMLGADGGPDSDEAESEQRWRVLVLEDAGELLGVQAKTDTGAALGRFLNVVDGMIGQGLRVLVIATTNEKHDRWHEAVTRPGRTLARVEVPPLDRAEAEEWLESRGVDLDDLNESFGSMALADLFDRLSDDKMPEQKSDESFGFGAVGAPS